MATPAPLPDGKSLVDLVAAPEETRQLLDTLRDQEDRGELKTHSHEQVLARLAKLGVRRSPEL
jgi:hypothetical protein